MFEKIVDLFQSLVTFMERITVAVETIAAHVRQMPVSHVGSVSLPDPSSYTGSMTGRIESPPPAKDQEDNKPKRMTKKAIAMLELDKLGVEYSKSKTAAELEEILSNARKELAGSISNVAPSLPSNPVPPQPAAPPTTPQFNNTQPQYPMQHPPAQIPTGGPKPPAQSSQFVNPQAQGLPGAVPLPGVQQPQQVAQPVGPVNPPAILPGTQQPPAPPIGQVTAEQAQQAIAKFANNYISQLTAAGTPLEKAQQSANVASLNLIRNVSNNQGINNFSEVDPNLYPLIISACNEV